jgi:chaperone required for assembly of F1-ATPase
MKTETEDERFERLSRDRTVRPMPKRFYKIVAVNDRLEITLDGRSVKTPLKVPLILPNRKLANAVAAEWEEQAEFINPHAMPLTKLANTAIDRASKERSGISAEILEFAGSDMVCYRADKPDNLVSRQSELWDPVISWAARDLGARFESVAAIIHKAQPEEAIKSVKMRVDALDPFCLAATHNLTTLSGSALLALMVLHGGISADFAWAAANVDEDWQIETWGHDDEAMARRAGRKKEFLACVNFVNLAQSLS